MLVIECSCRSSALHQKGDALRFITREVQHIIHSIGCYPWMVKLDKGLRYGN